MSVFHTNGHERLENPALKLVTCYTNLYEKVSIFHLKQNTVMKSKLLLIVISLIATQLNLNELNAQTSSSKLDQLALIQQYNGNWEGRVWDNTLCRFSITIKNKGGEGSFTYYTNEKDLGTGKQIWFYDEVNDIFMVHQLYDFKTFHTWKIKFVEPTKAICEIQNSKSEEPVVKWSMDFLPSGEMRQTLMSETKQVSYTYKKVK